MTAVIDNLDSLTGWIPGTASTISASFVNLIKDYIAGENSGSLVLHIPQGNLNKSIAKTITFDLTDYTDVVFHIWSRNKSKAGWDYKFKTDFAYQIEFGDGNVYMVPTFQSFFYVPLHIAGSGAITTIKITALHNDEDYLIISNMVATKDEIPVDIFRGIKTRLENEINSKYEFLSQGVNNKGIKLSTLDAAAGDLSIYLATGMPYIDKHAVIRIDDGANSEIHQIENNDQKNFTFNSNYDGAAILNDYTGASVYLTVPVEYGMQERDIVLPGISVWGMAPEEILRSIKEEDAFDTFKDDETVQTRLTPITFSYKIRLDCEARHNELIAFMSMICRSVTAKNYCWILGKKTNIFPDGPADYIEPAEGYNEIPKVQFPIYVEIREDLQDRSTLVKNILNNLNYNLVNQGGI